MLRCICTVGGVPSGPRTLLGCQSAKPKHLKGPQKNFLGLGQAPSPRNLFFLPFICLVLCFTTDCKEAVCPDLAVLDPKNPEDDLLVAGLSWTESDDI